MADFKFLLSTALRDSRHNRGKLVLFMSSIILGIAALVAINSFNDSLQKDVDKQAASLLGADLVMSSNKPASEAALLVFDSLPGEKAYEQELFSMAYLPRVEESQFVRLKALDGDFPFYGEFVTDPEEAKDVFRTTKTVLVEDALLLQYGLRPGDDIKLGTQIFKISGRLKTAFGSVSMTSSFAPTVYMAKEYLAETELVQPGSLVNYAYFAKVPEDFAVEDWRAQRRDFFRNESMGVDTVEERKEDLKEAFDSLNNFLNLVALVALLLGCIGVASSVFIYVKSKISSIAVLRCLGMKGSQSFMVYFIQILSLGIIGAIVGVILGAGIQVLLPKLLSDFLPFTVNLEISWPAITQGLTIGLMITILFSLLPLISVRKISPLRTLRASFDEDIKPKDPLRWVIYIAIVGSILIFLWQLTGDFKQGAAFSAGLLVAFLILYLVSKAIIWAVQKFFPRKWNFVLRQGLSNLFRPNNQTQTLLVSIGLGTAVLTTLFIIQGLLLENVSQMDAGNQPNMILYGIENEQIDSIAEITKNFELPVLSQVPIVTMALEGWKGKSKSEWLADTTRKARRWAINREARVSYTDSLGANDKLVRGEFKGNVEPGDSIYISLAETYADALDVDIGDELEFNVQGLMMKTYVSSIREIEFRNMQTRFFIMFPKGVLENAPQFHVLVTKTPDVGITAKYRNAVVKRYPNVTVVDLASILATVSQILDKVSYIIKFMAAFSILTGLIVLISSLLLSKFQRIKESVLFRTIGASKKQILQINATEYSLLGGLAAATGIIISIAGSFLLTKYQLELDFKLNWLPIIFVFLFVLGLTVIIGLLNSRDVVRKPPLEVLRKEVG